MLRTFYDFHLNEGTGPIINPFPLDRSRRGRANAHHTPGRPFQRERAGRYRPTIPHRAPRRIPDELFNALFAAARSGMGMAHGTSERSTTYPWPRNASTSAARTVMPSPASITFVTVHFQSSGKKPDRKVQLRYT